MRQANSSLPVIKVITLKILAVSCKSLAKWIASKKIDQGESSEKSRKVVVRKYDLKYIKYEFINAGTDLEPKAQCVECA